MGLGVQLFDDKYVNYIKRTGLNLYYNIKIPVNGIMKRLNFNIGFFIL